MKKTSRIGAIFMAFAMLFSVALTGCKSNPNTTSSTTSTVKEPWDVTKKDTVVISVINNYYTAGEKQLAKDYMKLHPETNVVVDVVADNDSYTAKLRTTLATDKNTAPDIIHANFLVTAFGSWQVPYDKGYLMDLTSMLDETNPYNDNKKVSASFSPEDLTLAISNAGGKMGMLPFDWCGVGFYYNKTIFDKLSITPPTTWEDLLADCAKLKSNNYKVPVQASGEAGWIETIIADIAYRPIESQLVAVPGDAMYDAKTMSGNTSLKYDPNNTTFDTYAVLNPERIYAFVSKNTINTTINKTVWQEFGKLTSNFQQNWTTPDTTAVISAFEAQTSPMMVTGSWNVGKVVADLAQLPKDKQFEWGTFKVPGFANPPAGFEAKIRSLYVFGNQMGILLKDNADHETRVKDVLKFWYSPKEAQMQYDVTLKSGNLVQGPPAVLGVKLSAENTLRLNGFVSVGNMRGDFATMVGQTQYLAQDLPIYNDLMNKLTLGTISIDDFMTQLNVVAMKYTADNIKKAGYDLNPATKDTPAK